MAGHLSNDKTPKATLDQEQEPQHRPGSNEESDPRRKPEYNMRRLVKRRRKPWEHPPRNYAVWNYCRECNGYEGEPGKTLNQTVWECVDYDCPLWLMRCQKDSRTGPDVTVPPKPWHNKPCPECGAIQGSCSECGAIWGQKQVLRPPAWTATARKDRTRAIKLFCKDCSGGDTKRCTVKECWLWNHRRGTVDHDE